MIIGAVSLSVGSAMADGIVVTDVYAIASSPMAKAGATFVRPKWGIYRSLKKAEDLRDEAVRFNDFSIKEGE